MRFAYTVVGAEPVGRCRSFQPWRGKLIVWGSAGVLHILYLFLFPETFQRDEIIPASGLWDEESICSFRCPSAAYG